MVKKVWTDPVWSKVIATAMLAVGATIGTYLFDLWPAIGSYLKRVIGILFSTTVTPNWILGLLAVLSMPAVIIVLALAWGKINPKKTEKSDWRSYRSDTFFGLRWRWKYFDDCNIYDVYTFCPHCDFQVFPFNSSAYHVVDRIEFHCDSCGQHLGEMDESFESVENKVKRFIQQKLRNQSWDRQGTA